MILIECLICQIFKGQTHFRFYTLNPVDPTMRWSRPNVLTTKLQWVLSNGTSYKFNFIFVFQFEILPFPCSKRIWLLACWMERVLNVRTLPSGFSPLMEDDKDQFTDMVKYWYSIVKPVQTVLQFYSFLCETDKNLIQLGWERWIMRRSNAVSPWSSFEWQPV